MGRPTGPVPAALGRPSGEFTKACFDSRPSTPHPHRPVGIPKQLTGASMITSQYQRLICCNSISISSNQAKRYHPHTHTHTNTHTHTHARTLVPTSGCLRPPVPLLQDGDAGVFRTRYFQTVVVCNSANRRGASDLSQAGIARRHRQRGTETPTGVQRRPPPAFKC